MTTTTHQESKATLVSPPSSPTSKKTAVKVEIRTKPKRAYRKSKPSCNHPKRQLAADFEPSSNSVICGRGKECFDSEGNKRFREIINKYLNDYAAAGGKSQKSAIVSKAMNIIKESCPDGAFIKQERGVWFEVSTRYAREKVGAWFRDCLHDKYQSSSKAKHARKMAKRVSFNALDPEDIMNFPLDMEFDLPDMPDIMNEAFIEDFVDRPPSVSSNDDTSNDDSLNSASSSTFYDIDDMSLSLLPFDTAAEV